MENIKLLPEQVKSIQERIGFLKSHIETLRQYLANEDRKVLTASQNQGFNGLPDVVTFNELSRTKDELEKLEETLRNAIIIEDFSEGQIEVGTKFVVTLKSGNSVKTAKHVLVDGGQHILELLSSEYKPVSVKSPFGQAVRSKKLNEVFMFCTPSNEVYVGMIEEIVPELEKTCSNDDKQLTK